MGGTGTCALVRVGRGGTDDLLRLAADGGFEVGVLDPILLDGIRISSSRIRQSVEEVASMKFDPCSGAITLYRVESLWDIAEAEN